MTSFNLTREPWIGVESLDGRLSELSTRETLARAHELRGLADESPLVIAALTRHLLAVLHRAYSGPQTDSAWRQIALSGGFERRRTDGYLEQVENRMDLFHPERPFAQTSGLREQFHAYETPIDELELPRSRWGGARELFRHRPSMPRPSMSPARAARALLAHQAFATGGLVKKPGEPEAATAAPLARAGLVLLRSETLFATLVANLLVYDPSHGRPIGSGGAEDRCAWEQGSLPRELKPGKEPKRTPFGYLDLLTWLSRRVELVREGGSVTGFINAVGKGLADESPRDPMVTYRRHEKLGWVPISIDVNRAFWRSANALFDAGGGEGGMFERPKAVDLVAQMADVLGRDAMYDVEVMGIAAEKSRVDAVRMERVQTQVKCFNDAEAREAVRDCLDVSEKTMEALRSALFTYARAALAPGERDPDKESVRALVGSFAADPAAWSAVGVAFEPFLRRLGGDADRARQEFESAAGKVVDIVFRSVTNRAATNGRWLKARALAERTLAGKLKALAADGMLAGQQETQSNG